MLVDLVHTKTEDGVTLSGIVLEPERPRTDLLVDAMVMVHGSGGNFYLSPSNPRAAKLRDRGIPTALFNTRGHDVIGGRAGKIRTGNAYETLSETHLDPWLPAGRRARAAPFHVCRRARRALS